MAVSRCGYDLSATLRKKDATAPLAGSGAFGLVLHWPFSGPDLYLGPWPAKETCRTPGPDAPANRPVLWRPTTAKMTYAVTEKWQAFRSGRWRPGGRAVTATV